MSDITLQRILAALERIEAELKRRPVAYTPSPQPAPAWRPTPYYEPRWVDGERVGAPLPGTAFDPMVGY